MMEIVASEGLQNPVARFDKERPDRVECISGRHSYS
jgi:hypothetical protein